MERIITAEEILKSLPTKFYVINLKSKEIIQTNNSFISDQKSLCYKVLFNKEKPCEIDSGECICQQTIKKKGSLNYIIEKENKNDKDFYKGNAAVLDRDLVLIHYENITEIVRAKKELKINSKRKKQNSSWLKHRKNSAKY